MAAPVLAPVAIAFGLIFLGNQALEGYYEDGGVSGALAHVMGAADVYESWTNQDWDSGEFLGQDDYMVQDSPPAQCNWASRPGEPARPWPKRHGTLATSGISEV